MSYIAFVKPIGAVLLTTSVLFLSGVPAPAAELTASAIPAAPIIDGDPAEWNDVAGITVPLTGSGGVSEVELKAAIHGDRIFVLAVWKDATESRLHKPYKWDENARSYQRTGQLEDRLAVSLAMTGDFSASKLSGAEFSADVWHWKASRSDPAGIAQDKMWKVSQSEFPKGKAFKTEDGQTIWLARSSDKGDRLYRPVKYDVKDRDLMPRYEVNLSPAGSIADVSARGKWRDGRWFLEMSRKLDTGNADDAVIPASGAILIAVAAFNDIDGRNHSSSDVIILRTAGASN